MKRKATVKSNKEKGLEEARQVAEFALAKNAEDLVILDIRGLSNICDYYVICSAGSAVQVKAIYDEVTRKSREKKINIQHSEVDKTYHWVLVDYSNIILHIFREEARKFYNLEYLWKQAKRIYPAA